MKLPNHPRWSSARYSLLTLACVTSLGAGLVMPAYSAVAQAETPTESQTTHAEERAARQQERQQEREAHEREHAEQRAAREQEREALETKREEERTAKRNARGSGRDGSGTGAGEAGTDPSSDPNTDVSAKALHGCQLSIKASSQRITAGETVVLSGALTCPAQATAASQQIALYERQMGPGAPSLDAVETVSTGTEGSYELTSPALQQTTMLQVRIGRHHARVIVKVAPLITLTSSIAPPAAAAPTTVTATTKVTFSGTVSPAVEGERVALQISHPSSEEHWQTIAYGRVDAEGGYAIAHAFHHPGKVNVRTVVHPHGPDVKGISAPLAYEVLPPEPSPSGLASQFDAADAGD